MLVEHPKLPRAHVAPESRLDRAVLSAVQNDDAVQPIHCMVGNVAMSPPNTNDQVMWFVVKAVYQQRLRAGVRVGRSSDAPGLPIHTCYRSKRSARRKLDESACV